MVENGLLDPAVRTVLAVARDVLVDLDLEAVLGRVLDSARELSGASHAALGVLGESRRELERFITAGVDDATRERIGAPPHGNDVLGELIDEPRPLRLPEVSEHPRSCGFPPGHPPMKSFLGVPIMVAGQRVGNLYLTDKAGGEQFTDGDEVALTVLAEFAGVAIDHARSYAGLEARRAGLERTVDALNATLQISHSDGGEMNIDATLELVAAACASVAMGARTGDRTRARWESRGPRDSQRVRLSRPRGQSEPLDQGGASSHHRMAAINSAPVLASLGFSLPGALRRRGGPS